MKKRCQLLFHKSAVSKLAAHINGVLNGTVAVFCNLLKAAAAVHIDGSPEERQGVKIHILIADTTGIAHNTLQQQITQTVAAKFRLYIQALELALFLVHFSKPHTAGKLIVDIEHIKSAVGLAVLFFQMLQFIFKVLYAQILCKAGIGLPVKRNSES